MPVAGEGGPERMRPPMGTVEPRSQAAVLMLSQ